MPRYLSIWEMDRSKVPADPKERMAFLKKMLEMTKQALKDNPGSQWGISISGTEGFALSPARRKWQDAAKGAWTFAPFIKGKILQVMSAEEAEDVLNSMTQQK